MIKNLYYKYRIYGLKKFILYTICEVKYKSLQQFIRSSYSQKGEDLIIDRILRYKKNGFYVDVGAYDPNRFSNTKRFYLRGWCGINIEPNIKNYEKFVNNRPRDINLNIGIGTEERTRVFYNFIPDTLSTFSREEAEKYQEQGYRLIEVKKIRMTTLKSIFEQYCGNKYIDFISIDTEGFDLEVLKSNNWRRYRPQLVCIESISHCIDSKGARNTKIDEFLIKINYKKIYDNGLNSIYQDYIK